MIETKIVENYLHFTRCYYDDFSGYLDENIEHDEIM